MSSGRIAYNHRTTECNSSAVSMLRVIALLKAPTYSTHRPSQGVIRRSGLSRHSEDDTGSTSITAALGLRPPEVCPLRKQWSDRAYTYKLKSSQNHPDISHDVVPIHSQTQLGNTMVHINPVAQVNQSWPFSVFSLQQVDGPSASPNELSIGQNVRIAYMTLEILH